MEININFSNNSQKYESCLTFERKSAIKNERLQSIGQLSLEVNGSLDVHIDTFSFSLYDIPV